MEKSENTKVILQMLRSKIFVSLVFYLVKVFIFESLEAFSVNNGWTGLVIFLFGDPHLLEGGEGSKDGSTDPD